MLILFLCISSGILIPSFPFKHPQHNSLPSDFMRVYAHRCTHSHLTALFFLSNGTKPSQNLVPPLPLMQDKAPLCYICSWSHGSLYVYSLVGVFVPVSSGVSSWLISLLFLSGCKPLHLLWYLLISPTGVPVLIQWLPANICNCICQVLIVSFRRHP